MRISEVWTISRFPYREVAYRPAARSGYPLKGKDLRADARIVKRVLLAATVNKIFFAVFTAAGASFPFALYELGFESISLSAALSLSLILYLGYLVLYLIQVLPSFVDAESFTPLRILPMTDKEVSAVSLLSYLRTVDFILLLGISTQVLIVGFITRSVLAGALMLLAAIVNSVFATAIALWLTDLFRRVMSREGRSSAGSALRLILVAIWGLGVMSVVFLFNLASLVTPYLDSALSQTSQQAFLVLAAVHPFSLSIVIARIVGSGVNPWAVPVSVASSVAYCCFAVLAARWSMRTVNSIGRHVNTGARAKGRDSRIVTHRPLFAYIIKDLRVASRNPSTGFLFALPIFETLAVVVPLASSHIVRTAIMLVASVVGGALLSSWRSFLQASNRRGWTTATCCR